MVFGKVVVVEIGLAESHYSSKRGCVPEVFRKNGYRFFFFSREAAEPIHIHVEMAEKYAKFWIDPVVLAESYGFLGRQLREIRKMIEENETLIRRKWNDHIDGHRQSQN